MGAITSAEIALLSDEERQLREDQFETVYEAFYIVSLVVVAIAFLLSAAMLRKHRKTFRRVFTCSKRSADGSDEFKLHHFYILTSLCATFVLTALLVDMYGLKGIHDEETRVNLYMAAFAICWFPLQIGFYLGLSIAVEFLPVLQHESRIFIFVALLINSVVGYGAMFASSIAYPSRLLYLIGRMVVTFENAAPIIVTTFIYNSMKVLRESLEDKELLAKKLTRETRKEIMAWDIAMLRWKFYQYGAVFFCMPILVVTMWETTMTFAEERVRENINISVSSLNFPTAFQLIHPAFLFTMLFVMIGFVNLYEERDDESINPKFVQSDAALDLNPEGGEKLEGGEIDMDKRVKMPPGSERRRKFQMLRSASMGRSDRGLYTGRLTRSAKSIRDLQLAKLNGGGGESAKIARGSSSGVGLFSMPSSSSIATHKSASPSNAEELKLDAVAEGDEDLTVKRGMMVRPPSRPPRLSLVGLEQEENRDQPVRLSIELPKS